MNENSNVVPLRQPDEIDDPLTNILRSGARQLLAQAVEMEAEAFLAAMKGLKLPDGRDRLVRHGHGPTRTIQTGIGAVEVARVKIRDRAAAERWRADSLHVGDPAAVGAAHEELGRTFAGALPAGHLDGRLPGGAGGAPGQGCAELSPAVISRLTAEWQGEYERWQKRDLSARRYVYVWADGVFLQARMEDHGECMLVLIGATPEGKKELIGFQVGVRESAQSWRELLVEAKSRGLKIAPEIAVGDGALGFWKALDEVFPATRHQRCWVHKTANILNKVALSVQANMKKDLREVYLAPNRASAEVAIDVFAEKYGAKYDKAVECLTKDRDAMLALYDFPAEHWDHLRTTNPIESVFATVRHRTVRTKGSLSSTTAKLMVFKLLCAASKTWRRLKGTNQLQGQVSDLKTASRSSKCRQTTPPDRLVTQNPA